jgi:hypothetical protein
MGGGVVLVRGCCGCCVFFIEGFEEGAQSCYCGGHYCVAHLVLRCYYVFEGICMFVSMQLGCVLVCCSGIRTCVGSRSVTYRYCRRCVRVGSIAV